MRRLCCVVCLIAMILLFSGCSVAQTEYEKPIDFYYCKKEVTFGNNEGVISYETRECSHIENLDGLLEEYMAGPSSDELSNPFPSNIKFLNIATLNNHLIVMINQKDTSLTGISLTLACTCLGLTLLDHTNAECVEFYGEDDILDGHNVIIIDKNMLQLVDDTKLYTD